MELASSPSRKHRLFVALDLPPDAAPALAALREDLPGARWTRPGHHHLTLQFIGEVESPQMHAITEVLGTVAGTAFSLSIRGVGVFPGLRRPRVLVLHLLPEDWLTRLQQDVQAALTGAGVVPEQRPFKAHITLARFRFADPAAVRAYLNRHARIEAAPFPATAFHLYESTLKPSGSAYRRVRSYPLG